MPISELKSLITINLRIVLKLNVTSKYNLMLYDIKGNERMSDFSLPKYNVILDDYIAL